VVYCSGLVVLQSRFSGGIGDLQGAGDSVIGSSGARFSSPPLSRNPRIAIGQDLLLEMERPHFLLESAPPLVVATRGIFCVVGSRRGTWDRPAYCCFPRTKLLKE
jgi:hypothetical protein